MNNSTFSNFFTFHMITFGVIFIVCIVSIIFAFSISVKRIMRNAKAPKLSVPATVVTKRTSYSHHHHGHDHLDHGTTFYHATFEVESGDRMELSMSGSEYGLLVEGDRGIVTFKGTEFLSFDRER